MYIIQESIELITCIITGGFCLLTKFVLIGHKITSTLILLCMVHFLCVSTLRFKL